MKRWGKGYIYGFDLLKTKLKKKSTTTNISEHGGQHCPEAEGQRSLW